MPKCADRPWERQNGEGEKAFAAFVIYRDMGRERTVTAVAKQLSKSRQLVERWKERWNWQERVRAYDNELEKEAKAAAVKATREMAERHIRIAMQLQKKALEALQNLSVKKMTAKDIKEYIKMATELERLNRMSEEQDRKTSDSTTADTLIEAYVRRMEVKEDGNT